jgi:hypothetical protein
LILLDEVDAILFERVPGMGTGLLTIGMSSELLLMELSNESSEASRFCKGLTLESDRKLMLDNEDPSSDRLESSSVRLESLLLGGICPDPVLIGSSLVPLGLNHSC